MERLDWIGVLACSAKYQFTMGITEAWDNIVAPSETPFHPVYKIRIAWLYSLTEHYESCARDLLDLPPLELSRLDYRDLGPEITDICIQTRLRIQSHRIRQITHIPNCAHDRLCLDNNRCQMDWGYGYSIVTLFFAHTARFFSGREVFEKLSTLEIPGLFSGCRQASLEQLKVKGTLWKEETFVEEGVDVICAFMRNHQATNFRPEPRFLSTAERKMQNGLTFH